jgi:hypothetical protein
VVANKVFATSENLIENFEKSPGLLSRSINNVDLVEAVVADRIKPVHELVSLSFVIWWINKALTKAEVSGKPCWYPNRPIARSRLFVAPPYQANQLYHPKPQGTVR